MKKSLKKITALFLIIILLFSNIIPALAFTYPDGIDSTKAKTAILQTDKLVDSALSVFKNEDLSDLIHSSLYKDETLSSVLTGLYSSLTEYTSVISMAEVDIKPCSVANYLSAYPEIKNSLLKYENWEGVTLTNCKWNVNTERKFANAIAAMLSPFNNLLYMLLCNGSAKFSILKIQGSNGYETGIVPILQALNCSDIKSQKEFTALANKNKNNMISEIIMSIFSEINKICDKPATEITDTLPKFSYFTENGGLENAINNLMSPLTLKIGNLKNIITSTNMLSMIMFISSPGTYSINFTKNLHTTINNSLTESQISVPEIDFTALAEIYNYPEQAYILIINYLIDALKQNKEAIFNNFDLGDLKSTVDTLISKDTNEITAFIINLFTVTEGTALNYTFENKAYSPTSVTYTANLGQEKYTRVVDGIDEVIEEFIKESDSSATLEKTVKSAIYSNNILTTLVKTVYSALSDDKIKSVIKMLNIPTTPYELSKYISGNGSKVLANLSSFDKITGINWGFNDGNRDSFEKRLTEILTPFIPLLDCLLANGTLSVFDSINIGGSNGYETAIIPLLEAIGCNEEDIATYSEYEKNKGNDKMVTLLLKPLLNLIDEIAEKPVYTALEIVPNILFFIENGNAMQCVDNLLTPLNTATENLGIDINSLGFNLDEIKQKDIIDELSKKVPELTDKIKLSVPDIKSLASLGTSIQKDSKTSAGKFQYIEADKTAVLITVLRYIVTQLKNPDNGNVLSDLMSSSTEGNEMFAMSTSSITEKFDDMTVDEIIEFLYKLLFRERAIEETSDDGYIPSVIYEEKTHINFKLIVIICVIIIAVTVVCIVKRKEIAELIEKIKILIAEKRGNK